MSASNDAFVEVTTTRHNPMIDPTLHVWGWEVPVYLFLGGLTAGLLILCAMLELRSKNRPLSTALRSMPFVGIVLLTVGMVTLLLDLEYKAHALRFYTTFQPTSAMSWGSWILAFVYPVALLMGIGGLAPRGRRALRRLAGAKLGPVLGRGLARLRATRRSLLWLAIGSGIALGIYTGVLLGTMAARPLWNSLILGPLFLASGFSTGAAFLLLFRVGASGHRLLVRWDLAVIAIELGLIALLLLDLATGPGSARAAAQLLLGGPWTGVFWSLVVVLGLVVPLAMEVVEMKRHLPASRLTPVLILIGGLALRVILVSAGQASSTVMMP